MAQRYNIQEHKEVIREIQRYLLTVTPAKENPGVTMTGVYDAPTEEWVRQFQRQEALNETGIVDSTTWYALWNSHSEINRANEPPYLLGNTVFDMAIGDSGYHIVILQSVLGELSHIYPNVSRPAITGQFGLSTADAVRAMQRNYGMYSDGIVTPSLWNLMSRDHLSKKQLLQYSHIY